MRGFLTRIIERRLRRLALGAVVGVAIGSMSLTVTDAAHPGLDGADLAAARAEILLTGVCGTTVEAPAGPCELRLQKALVLLARVRATINEAKTTAAGSS